MCAREPGATRQLAGFVRGIRYEDLPADVVTMVKWLTLNILGCAVRGYSLEACQVLARVYQGMGGNPDATVLGTNVRLPVPAAAAINADAAYSTMNDDTFFEGPSHPGHSVIAAALATAEKERKGGVDFLTACVAGFETSNRIIASLAQDPGAHYARFGWRINIVDTFCAGIPAAKLLDLDEDQLTAIFGIAAGSASGIMETQLITYFWAWDGGRATYLGTLGAYMAKEGMTAGQTALEGDYGFVRMYAGGNPPEQAFTRLTRGLGTEWEVLNMQIKRWCADCRGHPAIDAAQKAVLDNGVDPRQIKRIELSKIKRTRPWLPSVRVPIGGPPDFNTSVFSIPYAVAVAIVNGREFALVDDMIAHLQDPVVKAIMDKVTVEKEEDTFPSLTEFHSHKWPGWAIVETNDGRRFEAHVEQPKGKFPENPFTEEEIIYKFRRNASHKFKPGRLDQIVDMVKNLEKVGDMRELAELLQVR